MYMKKYEDDKPTCENNNTFLQFRMYVDIPAVLY